MCGMNKDKVNGLGLKAGDRVRIVIEDKVEMAFPVGTGHRVQQLLGKR